MPSKGRRQPGATGERAGTGRRARSDDAASAPTERTRRDTAGPNRPPRKAAGKAKSAPAPNAPRSESMRIAKAIANAGLCSRRDAEKLIAEGRVKLNGRRIDSPALNVAPSDRVQVDGQVLPGPEPVRLWRYHKPRGRVTTHKDPEGRPTVFEAMSPDLPRVISVGRLDFNTEGLLLLTTSGDIARHLELPATGWLRRYRVRVHGRVTETMLEGLKDGITVDGVRYGPIEARLERTQGANAWINIAIREGKNREVRRVLTTLDLEVTRLIRVSYGPFQLGDLATGAVEEVRTRILADQLGPELAEAHGLGPVERGTRREPGREAGRELSGRPEETGARIKPKQA